MKNLGLTTFCVLIWMAAVALGAPQTEDHADIQFYEGLRQRGLFSIVENSLQEQLNQESLTPSQQAYLQLELSRTFAAHAEQRLGQEQSELWKLALTTAESSMAEAEETKWYSLLLLQAQLVPLQKTCFDLFQLQLSQGNTELRSRITSDLHEHLNKLRQLEVTLNRESREILGKYRDNSQNITPFEFRSVQKEVIYQVARTLSHIAEVEYSSHTERTAPVRAALDRLKTLSGGADDESITWKARLLTLRCYGLQHEFEAARILIQRYDGQWPTEFRDDVVEEQVKIDLENQQPDLAFERLDKWRKIHGYLAGELSLLNLRATADLWEIAWKQNREQLASDLLDQLKSEASRTQQEVGGIWGWRAQVFVDQTLRATKYGPDVAAKIQIAQSEYQSGRFAEAVVKYREASELAESKNRPEVAAEMLFTAGSVLLQRQQYEEARELFSRSVDRFPESQRSADCHLMWTWCLGKTYEQSPTKSHRLAYTSALDEHLEMFKESETAGSAHLMYGQFQENRLQDTKAIEHYLSVPLKHPKQAIAALSLVRCYQKILNRLEAQDRSTSAWRKEAINRLSERTNDYGEEPTSLTISQSKVILGLVSFYLGESTHDSTETTNLINRVIKACEIRINDSPEKTLWKEIELSAYQLKIVLLAKSGRHREAEALIAQIAKAGVESLLQLLNGLSLAAEKASPQTRKGIAELQLQTCNSLRPRKETLSKEQLTLLERTMARSLILAERTVEAHSKYEALIQQHPKDLLLRREYATSLSACDTVSCHHRAVIHWQHLENQAEKGSSNWLRYRAEVINSLQMVGKNSEAARLLKITELLYPELGDETLRDKYHSLHKKIDREK